MPPDRSYIVSALQEIIASALPCLELPDWEDGTITLPRSFFTNLARSPVQHLGLFYIQVELEAKVNPGDGQGNGQINIFRYC
jgi:hypothetical protein